MGKKDKFRCLWCLKTKWAERKVIKKGVLKGCKITEIHCSKKCEKLFKLYFKMALSINDFLEIRKKMRKGRKEKKEDK